MSKVIPTAYAHLLKFPDGQTYSVDVGMSGKLLLPFLQSKGLRQIDKVFITHPHKDHYGDVIIRMCWRSLRS